MKWNIFIPKTAKFQLAVWHLWFTQYLSQGLLAIFQLFTAQTFYLDAINKYKSSWMLQSHTDLVHLKVNVQFCNDDSDFT